MLSDFHFIRPDWLLLVLPVLLAYGYARRRTKHSAWQRYLPPAVVKALTVKESGRLSNWFSNVALTALLLLVVAAAGPTLSKQAVPTIENSQATVLILDLSPSMLAEDLTPNRLTRARFKVIDFLRAQADGQVALVAYAGDAHTVSPLTDDPRTIEALLPALEPGLMPVAGSNVEAAIELAVNLLKDAGHPEGDLVLFTDGVAESAARAIGDALGPRFRLSILGVSGLEPAPIPRPQGGFVQASNGEIVLTKVDPGFLRQLAQKHGGVFQQITADDKDVSNLVRIGMVAQADEEGSEQTAEWSQWQDLGHWLVLLVLPLVLWYFRKGVVYLVPLIILIQPEHASADDAVSWWKTDDQRAAKAYADSNYDEAARLFQRPDWAAISEYRAGNYEAAAEGFASLESELGVDATYNQANALALKGDYAGALAAYKRVLEAAPEHDDARHNKQVIEDLLNEQSQDQQSQDQQSQDQQSQDQQNQDQDAADTETESADQPLDQTPLSENSEQWLRSIQEDPSGLLRRKFQYQSQLRARQQQNRQVENHEQRY